MRFTGLASCLVIVAGLASAHPGRDISQDIVERREFLSTVKRNDLSHCATWRKLLKALIQEGVDIVLDYQVIDVDTCAPIPNAYVEMWHCNATGVYSGVVADGNGDSSDETNINKTFLRGIQKTNEDGVAQFESIFPGHYAGRAPHIHVMVHTNVTRYCNGTLGNDVSASHVGQTFFDQALISEVELQTPYNTNQQELTLNADDSIMAEEAAIDGVDPSMEYTLLDDSVSDGLFAWLAFGINATQVQSITPAVFFYEEGGVANADSGRGGDGLPGGEFPGGNGTLSSGVPSCTPTNAPTVSSTAA
ncbi:hypothetical protein DL771_009709 [Monosporascus sp. 5C6A]|nr:hypothetical protein DL771_009709 [Monosporascus sp. 5C6A]